MKKADAQRQINWRSKIIKHASEEHHNIARTCRHFGISWLHVKDNVAEEGKVKLWGKVEGRQ